MIASASRRISVGIMLCRPPPEHCLIALCSALHPVHRMLSSSGCIQNLLLFSQWLVLLMGSTDPESRSVLRSCTVISVESAVRPTVLHWTGVGSSSGSSEGLSFLHLQFSYSHLVPLSHAFLHAPSLAHAFPLHESEAVPCLMTWLRTYFHTVPPVCPACTVAAVCFHVPVFATFTPLNLSSFALSQERAEAVNCPSSCSYDGFSHIIRNSSV